MSTGAMLMQVHASCGGRLGSSRTRHAAEQRRDGTGNRIDCRATRLSRQELVSLDVTRLLAALLASRFRNLSYKGRYGGQPQRSRLASFDPPGMLLQQTGSHPQ